MKGGRIYIPVCTFNAFCSVVVVTEACRVRDVALGGLWSWSEFAGTFLPCCSVLHTPECSRPANCQIFCFSRLSSHLVMIIRCHRVRWKQRSCSLLTDLRKALHTLSYITDCCLNKWKFLYESYRRANVIVVGGGGLFCFNIWQKFEKSIKTVCRPSELCFGLAKHFKWHF